MHRLYRLRFMQAGRVGKHGAAHGDEKAHSVILVILSKIRVVPVPQNRRTFADEI